MSLSGMCVSIFVNLLQITIFFFFSILSFQSKPTPTPPTPSMIWKDLQAYSFFFFFFCLVYMYINPPFFFLALSQSEKLFEIWSRQWQMLAVCSKRGKQTLINP